MRKKPIIIFITVLLIILSSIIIILKFVAPITEPYDYPIKPLSEELKNLQKEKKGYEMCVVPDNILSRMTTDALVETIANYPFLVDGVILFDNFTSYINNTLPERGFNGIEELRNRDDRVEAIQRYLDKHKEEYEFNKEDIADVYKWDMTQRYEIMERLYWYLK